MLYTCVQRFDVMFLEKKIWETKRGLTNKQWSKLISEMILLFSAKSYDAELRQLGATSTDAECRATVDRRLSRCADVYLVSCNLALICLNSALYDLALKIIILKISFS